MSVVLFTMKLKCNPIQNPYTKWHLKCRQINLSIKISPNKLHIGVNKAKAKKTIYLSVCTPNIYSFF